MPNPTHDAVVTAQFGPRAGFYLTSAVHAAGVDLDALVALIGDRPEATLLDLGCGGGHVAYLLAPRLRHVTAVDLSDAMLATVTAEAARRGLENLDTRLASVERLPFADAGFDIVVSRYSAHHWHDVAAGLREARRVLKPGGLAVFIDVVAPEAPLLDTWLQSLELLRDPSHVRNYGIHAWERLLREAGIAPGAVSRFRLPLEFSAWIRRMATPPIHTEAIRSLQAAAAAEVREHFEIQADGSFTLDTMLMVGAG